MAQQTKCRKKTEARREAILDAALEEFAAKGYAGARTPLRERVWKTSPGGPG